MYYKAIQECPFTSQQARISKNQAMMLMHMCPVAKERFPVQEKNKKMK